MNRIEQTWQGDHLRQDFGMKLLEAREGYAKVAVAVQERFLNAHGIGHGALIFAVADTAFGLAVNAITDAVGVQWSLNVFRPAKAGQEIAGEARAIHSGRQSLVCELTVTADDGRVLARGLATALPRSREPGAKTAPAGGAA
jgi:phenylacetic acid degradation protein PaaD